MWLLPAPRSAIFAGCMRLSGKAALAGETEVSSSTGLGSGTSRRDVLAGCPGGFRFSADVRTSRPDPRPGSGSLTTTAPAVFVTGPDQSITQSISQVRRLVCVPLRHVRWLWGCRHEPTHPGSSPCSIPSTRGRPLHPARRVWPATAAPSGAGSASPGSQHPVYPKAEREEYGTAQNQGDEMECVLLKTLSNLENSSPPEVGFGWFEGNAPFHCNPLRLDPRVKPGDLPRPTTGIEWSLTSVCNRVFRCD